MFSNPVHNLTALGLRDTDIVADLGAGTGFYSVAAGHMVPHGRVYAVEIQKDFLPTIKNKAHDAHLKNVEIIWGDVEKPGGTGIGDNVADAVIASNILLQVTDKDKFVSEVKRILKPGGKVLIIDWRDHAPLHKHIVPKDRARDLFTHKGFSLEREVDAGAHHYGIILRKNESR